MGEPNRDQTEGQVKQATGNAKEEAGAITGDRSLEREGTIEKRAGIDQERAGDVHEAADRLDDALTKV